MKVGKDKKNNRNNNWKIYQKFKKYTNLQGLITRISQSLKERISDK